ncbi:zinc finger MYM-type protein 1-like [Camellia sinensis]|uniref:zinc finger MYM-type protein 1-like n=1 Tax=Camellia sinensis TaxID=4442 RepID=UPI001036C3E0|nr:zinc finger MYM-type protein 1-like [Camellia sinensis]
MFREHDESENLSNQGNFIEFLKFLTDHNEDVKVVTLSNAPQNLKLTSPDIRKNIVNVAAFETINVIIRDLSDTFFSVLIDEARNISIKEQMADVIQYVDKKGQVIECFLGIERFLGIEHVANMNALSLKQAVENLFSRLGLSISKLRGQGYDRASNMQAVAKNHNQIALLFTVVSNIVNVVGASCKRRDIVREKQAAKVAEALNTRELSMIDVLEMISDDGSNSEQRVEANILLDSIQLFEFVFNLHLMKTILAITSEALQKKDQDIVNAMNLVQISKVQLQKMREIATATVERVFSAMNIVKNRLRN